MISAGGVQQQEGAALERAADLAVVGAELLDDRGVEVVRSGVSVTCRLCLCAPSHESQLRIDAPVNTISGLVRSEGDAAQ